MMTWKFYVSRVFMSVISSVFRMDTILQFATKENTILDDSVP